MQLTNLHLAVASLAVIAIVVWMTVRAGRLITKETNDRLAEESQEQRDFDARERRRMLYEADAYNEACSRDP